MKRLLLTLLLLGFTCSIRPAQGEDRATNNPSPATLVTLQGQKRAGEGHLGVAVESVPAALRSQLSGVLSKGEGVFVVQVSKDSPAAKAGLKPYDILTGYGDQKLSSPDQLIKLVRHAKAGQEVAIAYVRGGKAENCKAVLDERDAIAFQSEFPPSFRPFSDEQMQQFSKEFLRPDDPSAWDSFDAMKLSRLDGKRWHAEVEFRAKDGKKERKVFEGTREELRKNIMGEKDLPANERRHLLRALNLQMPGFDFRFGPGGPLGPGTSNQP